jgi:hypothetical protein
VGSECVIENKKRQGFGGTVGGDADELSLCEQRFTLFLIVFGPHSLDFKESEGVFLWPMLGL